MFTDASALVIALIASSVAARPADDRRTFGYQRAEVFGALINAIILIVLMVVVAVQGVQRLLDPGEVEVAGPLMLIVAVIGLIANGISMWLLSAAQRTRQAPARCGPRPAPSSSIRSAAATARPTATLATRPARACPW